MGNALRFEIPTTRPENLNAYELYLPGGEKIDQLTSESIKESMQLLNRAVELDPELARAWVEPYHAYNLSRAFGIEDALRVYRPMPNSQPCGLAMLLQGWID